MNTKALRQKILDLAIHGKLVPQDPNDEPASVLLERIKAEKERLIKEGKIKRTKRSKAACDKPHYPYELPKGWAWCKLEDIVSDLLYGTSEKSLSEGLVPVLRMGNINRVGEIDWNNLVYTSNQADIAKYSLKQDDLLFNRTNSAEWVGKTAIYKGNKNAIYAGYIIRIHTISVNADYINYVMNSSYHRDWCDEVKTDAVNQSNINAQKLSQLYIPIPPYKEQERIVNSVQRWTTLINNIEIEKSDLVVSVAETKFKILDLAIHGKLVPQDPTDEPASVLLKRINPKAEIACDNPQYGKLPKGWCFVSVGNYVNLVTDFVASGSFASLRENVKYYNSPEYAILVRTKDFQNNFQNELVYTDKHGYDFLEKSNLHGGELVFSNVGSIGKVFIVPHLKQKMTLAPNAIMVRFHHDEHQKWFYYLFQSSTGLNLLHSITSATAIGKFNKTDFKKLVIPIPPLSEQHRIVEKIEELFAQLDKIEVSL